jgi:hypothetical protein|tara:strand:- start:195 stop:680 length:486 start_codon:yes stop_codon:yes gene_type:complete
MTKLCARGKAAAKRKFKVYPSAYANAYASKICAGKIKDPSGVKRKDFKGPKPAGKKIGGEAKGKIKEVMSGLKKASQTHAAQAKTLSTLKLKYGGGKDMGAKKKKKKARDRYDNNLEDLPKGLQIDTTTNSSGSSTNKMMCGGEVRGTGAAIRGKGFKGIF